MKKETEYPQAFPDPMRGAEQSYHNQGPHELETGMTLRGYFAAKYMQANSDNDQFSLETLAKESYIMADEMLKARLK